MTLNTNSKKRSGFTLVEVIVVAVIVLVLSAVAIPMYNGYVRGARADAMENLAETAAAAANTMWRRMGDANLPPNFDGAQQPNTPPLNVHFISEPAPANRGHTVTVDQTGGTVTVRELRTNPLDPVTANFR